MIEYKPRPHRLILSHSDIMRVRRGNHTFIRPCAASTIEEAHKIYQEKGSPWGRAIETAITDVVYSSERLLKTPANLIMYEDGKIIHETWPAKWSGRSQRAMYQPRKLARFEADVAQIDVKFMDQLHQTDMSYAGFTVSEFREYWNERYPDQPVESNPLVWVIEMGEVRWQF